MLFRSSKNFICGRERKPRLAAVAVTPEDIIDEMGWETIPKKPQKQPQPTKNLSETAREVYAVLELLPATQDVIVSKLRERGNTRTIPQVCQGLVELELKGFILCRDRQYGRLRDDL